MINNSKSTDKLGFTLLLFLCIATLFFFLGDTFFNTRGEPREAIVAFSMLEHGNWILPINNGDEIAFKPPMLHWCIAALSTLTGSVSEFTSRFPSAFSVLLMVMTGFVFYRKRRNWEIALLMGIITLTNFEVHRAAYACRVDMLLSALTVMALYALYRWIEKDMKGIPWLAWALMSAAALTKGPVGVVLPCGVAGVYLLLRGHHFFSLLWRYGLLAVCSFLPLFIWYWFAYNEPHGGERFLQLIYEENVLRFTGGMTYASHVNPWTYNVMTIITGMLPYTLLVLMVLPFCGKYIKSAFSRSSLKSLATLKTFREMNDLQLYSFLSFFVIFVFYCIPMSKRSVYLLPVYPFMSYFLAEFICWIRKEHTMTLRNFGHFIAGTEVLLALLFFSIRMGWIPEDLIPGKHAAENISYMHALHSQPLSFLDLIVITLPLASALYFWMMLHRPNEEGSRWLQPYRIMFMIFALFFALDGFYQPVVLNTKSDKNIAEKIQGIVPEGRIYSYRPEFLAANRMHPFTINFYLDDRVIPIDKATAAPASGFLIVSGNSIEKFNKEYPQYQTEFVFKSTKRSCDDHQPVYFYQFSQRNTAGTSLEVPQP